MSVRIECLSGPALDADARLALARVRMRVFREWPYLYEGSLEYELDYLATYLNSANSLIVQVRDGDRLVGASTALPLLEAEPDMHAPFLAQGHALQDWLYFGESVLLPNTAGGALAYVFSSSANSMPSICSSGTVRSAL